jgi:DNA-binding transcriptional regulator YdaS (Cro superfamily)
MTKSNALALAVARVVDLLGSQANLARELGYEDVRNVSPWTRGDRPFPPHHCVSIERATQGAVTRRDLRPDDWHLIWPELIEKDGVHCVQARQEA